MIELIILFLIMGWFAKEANTIGKNGILWAIIAALSFYIPVLIFGRIIYPFLIMGRVTYSNQSKYIILGTVLNFVIGAFFVYIARTRLLHAAKQAEKNLKSDQSKRVPFIELENPKVSIGQNAYDKDKNIYLGKIVELNLEDKTCVIKTDFGKEKIRSMNDILVKID